MSDKLQVSVNQPDECSKQGIRGWINFQCPFTEKCQNHKCFWKQRDTHNRCAWYVHDNPEHDAEQRAITDQYGEPYFPEWKVQTGTNNLMAHCPDFKDPEEPSA